MSTERRGPRQGEMSNDGIGQNRHPAQADNGGRAALRAFSTRANGGLRLAIRTRSSTCQRTEISTGPSRRAARRTSNAASKKGKSKSPAFSMRYSPPPPWQRIPRSAFYLRRKCKSYSTQQFWCGGSGVNISSIALRFYQLSNPCP